MIGELTREAQIAIPGRFFNGQFVNQAYRLIKERSDAGLMIPRSKSKLRRMARHGNLVGLVVEENGKEQLVGIGGITHEFREGLLRKVHIAEFGALAVDADYSGNGFAKTLIRESARRYVTDPSKAAWRTPDFMLIGMVGFDNVVSNKAFQTVGGNLLDRAVLPDVIFEEGRNYNTYDITSVGQVRRATA